ncbi:tryptophan synthase subunit alpha [Tissierella creatinini]|nr:tryptophan synthase subunit alpha [Tissierella creatinini]TJX61846.1 tryptophan synthase subunit alpha [Soehngenia saccharolytica]
MSRIKNTFGKDKVLIAFVTGGDPNIETTKRLIRAISAAGADIIEIGIPFSDPIAEGPVIQAASARALAAGCTTDKLLDMVAELRKDIKTSLLFMTYANPVFAYGKEGFMKRCAECGIDGLIIPDTPYEERDEFAGVCSLYSIDLISMVTPTSADRAKEIAKVGQGFLYCVSSLGVTGVRDKLTSEIANVIKVVREVSDIPCAIGFGISTPEQAKQMVHYADGVIVGSAIVKLIAEHGVNSIEPVAAYVSEIKKAIRGTL